jgi:hypothetical protein
VRARPACRQARAMRRRRAPPPHRAARARRRRAPPPTPGKRPPSRTAAPSPRTGAARAAQHVSGSSAASESAAPFAVVTPKRRTRMRYVTLATTAATAMTNQPHIVRPHTRRRALRTPQAMPKAQTFYAKAAAPHAARGTAARCCSAVGTLPPNVRAPSTEEGGRARWPESADGCACLRRTGGARCYRANARPPTRVAPTGAPLEAGVPVHAAACVAQVLVCALLSAGRTAQCPTAARYPAHNMASSTRKSGQKSRTAAPIARHGVRARGDGRREVTHGGTRRAQAGEATSGYDALVQHPDRTIIKRDPGALRTAQRCGVRASRRLMRAAQDTKSRAPGPPPTSWATT